MYRIISDNHITKCKYCFYFNKQISLLIFLNIKIILAHVVWQNFSGGCNTHIYLPQIGSPWQTKVWIPPKPSLVNQWAFGGFYLQKYSEWLLPGAEMSQTSCITKAHLSMGDSSEIREPGAHSTASKQLKRLFFPVASVGPNPFQAAQMVAASSRQQCDLRVFFAAWLI